MKYTDFYSRSTSPPCKISTSVLVNECIDKYDTGLHGIEGAEAIVKLLRMYRLVRYLVLGHNQLGDAGCVALFDHLRSEEGRRHKIAEISLNANEIGDTGLWAIARYLEDNRSLGALFLQNNDLAGNRPIMLRFALAVNTSNLHTLSFTCNKSLGEAICTTFLPNLAAPKLVELHLSVCSLGPSSTPALLSYLMSPRARSLRTLKMNGNPLGYSSVSCIVHALERTNWSIGWVEMYACRLQNEVSEGDGGWKKCEEQLRVKVVERNRFLGKKTAEDALILLPHARPALLAYARKAKGARARLPPELVIHVLSFLAPSLSTAQHLRVCTYAAAPVSLPVTGLSLSSSPAHGIPFRRPISSYARRHTCVTDASGFTSSCALLCARMRTMSTTRDEEHRAWLAKVGCDRFEPDTGVEPALELDHHLGDMVEKGDPEEN